MAPSPSRIAGDPKDAFIEPPAIRRQRLVNAMAKQKEQLWQNNNPGIPPIPKTRPSHADISKEIVQTINWIHRHFNHPNPFAVSPEAETNKVHDDNAKEYDRLIRDIQVQQFNLGLLVLGDSPQSFFAQSMSTLACIKHCQLALGQTTFQDTPCVFQYPGLGQYGNFEPTDDNLEELRHAVHWFKRAEVYMERCAAVFRVIWFESSQKVDTATNVIPDDDSRNTDTGQKIPQKLGTASIVIPDIGPKNTDIGLETLQEESGRLDQKIEHGEIGLATMLFMFLFLALDIFTLMRALLIELLAVGLHLFTRMFNMET